MARKSRKNVTPPPVQETEAICRAAIYVRLSVEDKQSRTASIETQQLIIAQFLERHPEISVYHTYIDNGATGTNFHRPRFQQMLSDIEAGLVNCVIVKDLSRLGRNTIDTGYYIETYFPQRGVRFIAVNENYDTADPDDAGFGILIPLRNMINEAYALDIGRKIKASQRQLMKDGKFIGARTPYGYLKAEDDCHQLIIDPVAAPVVRQIFQWAYEGAGLNTIAVRLNEAGITAPSHYKFGIGEISNEKQLGNGKWQTFTVAKILHSEVYTGDLVQGHTKIIDHKQVPAGPENLTVVRDTHEAIVSRELFDAVQKILEATAQASKAKTVRPYTANILKGKVFCAHCDRSLHRQRCIRKKTADRYIFHCLTNSRTAHGACPGVFIYEEELLESLTSTILDNLDAVLGQYALCMEAPAQQREARAELSGKITMKKLERTRLSDRVRGLYENLTLGMIGKDEYFDLRERYDAQITQINDELEQLDKGLAALDAQMKKYQSIKRDAQSIRKDRALTAELIDRLIERIEVTPEKQITVRFKYQSDYESYGEVLDKCKAM
jgi:DNA invertase Pin-like site-specific DNA recombinase